MIGGKKGLSEGEKTFRHEKGRTALMRLGTAAGSVARKKKNCQKNPRHVSPHEKVPEFGLGRVVNRKIVSIRHEYGTSPSTAIKGKTVFKATKLYQSMPMTSK